MIRKQAVHRGLRFSIEAPESEHVAYRNTGADSEQGDGEIHRADKRDAKVNFLPEGHRIARLK